MYFLTKITAVLTETPKRQLEKIKELANTLKDFHKKNQLKAYIEPLIMLIDQTDDPHVFYNTVMLLREMYRTIVTDQKMEIFRPDLRTSIDNKIKLIESGTSFKLKSKLLDEIKEALHQLGFLYCTKM
jgi:hypothetical protein